MIVFSSEDAFWNLPLFNNVTRYIFSITFHGIRYNIKLLPFTLKMDAENTNEYTKYAKKGAHTGESVL